MLLTWWNEGNLRWPTGLSLTVASSDISRGKCANCEKTHLVSCSLRINASKLCSFLYTVRLYTHFLTKKKLKWLISVSACKTQIRKQDFPFFKKLIQKNNTCYNTGHYSSIVWLFNCSFKAASRRNPPAAHCVGWERSTVENVKGATCQNESLYCFHKGKGIHFSSLCFCQLFCVVLHPAVLQLHFMSHMLWL